ncbi:MAG: S-ribosylhomocysteine lyase [candidate division Zixibacteria bacterium]|nr:S-ribosylhomocysteine lyase [candidate division Zixibacteria bacterium]
MEQTHKKPESFTVDHISMQAPQVRKVGVYDGKHGDKISKFDLRFVKPNTGAIPTGGIHTLEHLLATYMKTYLDGVIDISPMGCRTGFYMSVWGNVPSGEVQRALIRSLHEVLNTAWEDVPGISARECGNYRDHSLFAAKEYARLVLEGYGEL